VKARIRKKIRKRFEILDETLVQCFSQGRHRYWKLISALRHDIQYLARRWPHVYQETFGTRYGEPTLRIGEIDLGHYMAGRRD
jgi:hypothetical protein